MKDYLGTELERNKKNTALFKAMIHRAFGKKDQVMIAHHLTFEVGKDLETMNEIPSADTLIFDHEAMQKIFGKHFIAVMQYLCKFPAEERDAQLEKCFNSLIAF